LVLPSPPPRVGNLGQACTDRECTDRQTANTPGRRRVAGHGFSRGTASPPPPSPPPACKVQIWPKASIPRGEGQGRGPPKTTAEAVACYTTGTWESVGPLGFGRTRAHTQGFNQNADAPGPCSAWGLAGTGLPHANRSGLMGYVPHWSRQRFISRMFSIFAPTASECVEPIMYPPPGAACWKA